MNDLATTSQGGIISLLHGHGTLPRPFGQHIYLLTVVIAGTSYVEDIDELEPELEQGVRVNFFREPKNEYDERAIVIKNLSGHKLGYVPRNKNEILAHLMDAGKIIYGIVDSKEYEGEWLKVKLKVFMDD